MSDIMKREMCHRWKLDMGRKKKLEGERERDRGRGEVEKKNDNQQWKIGQANYGKHES